MVTGRIKNVKKLVLQDLEESGVYKTNLPYYSNRTKRSPKDFISPMAIEPSQTSIRDTKASGSKLPSMFGFSSPTQEALREAAAEVEHNFLGYRNGTLNIIVEKPTTL